MTRRKAPGLSCFLLFHFPAQKTQKRAVSIVTRILGDVKGKFERSGGRAGYAHGIVLQNGVPAVLQLRVFASQKLAA
jgi:hypothetical protein